MYVCMYIYNILHYAHLSSVGFEHSVRHESHNQKID